MPGKTFTPYEMIERLVSFDTTSRDSNLALIDFVADYLAAHGVESQRVMDDTGRKANLFATLGPAGPGGIVLSGHTDVVPVDDQDWTSDPFTLARRGGRLFGRGTADMKSFSAIVLALVPEFLARGLAEPIHIALTYDEEVGCLGVPRLIEAIAAAGLSPRLAIVGEPTEMKVVNRHKGVFRFVTTVTGLESHSAYVDRGVNAVMYAAEMVHFLKGIAGEFEAAADPGLGFDPPYSTVHVGRIAGGTAPNIVPRHCRVDWETRLLPGVPVDAVSGRFERFVEEAMLPPMHAVSAATGVETVRTGAVEGLAADAQSEAEAFALSLTGDNAAGAVSFGTEGGFYQKAGIPTVICGPGSILQAHKPDEYIEVAQVEACVVFMRRLMDRIAR